MSVQPGLTDSPEYDALYRLVNDRGLDLEGELKVLGAVRRAADEMLLRMIDEARVKVSRPWYGAAPKMTWEEIGKALGVSAQAASQLHKRARAAK